MNTVENKLEVARGGGRKDLTFVLITYNQEKYIREAVQSAFAQTYQPLEIILSDDGSTDKTYEIMRELVEGYKGPHSLILRKNIHNMGLIGHVNTIFAIVKTDYIIVAAGDDISEPHRAISIVAAISSNPLLVHSGYRCIDDDGNLATKVSLTENILTHDLVGIATSRKLYVGATGVWHRDLYKIFGEIEFKEAYEDLVLGYRAALLGRVAYVELPLVKYRVGSGISTGKYTKERQILVCRSRIASFQQRLRDTEKIASDRLDLITAINRQISVERAILAYKTDFAAFLSVHLKKPEILSYLASVVVRRLRAFSPKTQDMN